MAQITLNAVYHVQLPGELSGCIKHYTDIQGVPKTCYIIFFFIKTQCFVLLDFYALIYKSACEVFFIKGHIIIIHNIICVSKDIIDDVIKFAKFSAANGTETG